MKEERVIDRIYHAHETMEGAGVRLHRGFGFFEVPRFDPFLLFDDFSSSNPADYLPGFPWHPHRGIETVTYVLDGDVRHHDSLGNSGVIGKGDIQWMTAGKGIIHEEMPEGTSGMAGFQLWVNLPQTAKMTVPRYQDLKAKAIPEITLGKHARGKIIAGKAEGVEGPIEDITASPLYLDITLEAEKSFEFPVVNGDTVFLYIIEGAIGVSEEGSITHERGEIILFKREGSRVVLRSGNATARFLLVSGKPIGEPVAWRGPIVMNTQEELAQAFAELSDGTFLSR